MLRASDNMIAMQLSDRSWLIVAPDGAFNVFDVEEEFYAAADFLRDHEKEFSSLSQSISLEMIRKLRLASLR